MTHEPKEENPYIHSSHNWDSSLGRAKPEGNYENKYSSTMHMKPLFVCIMHVNFYTWLLSP